MCEPKQCGWCQDGWPRYQYNGKVFHQVPEPQATVPCEDQTLLFPRLADIKPGDRLIADDGFTCLSEGHVATVREDEEGLLYVECKEGEHYLSGQEDEDGVCIGLSHLGLEIKREPNDISAPSEDTSHG